MNNRPDYQENAPAPLTPDASPREIAEYAVSVLDAKKAREIRLLYTEKQTIIADYFVLCTGTSSAQIKSLADEVEYRLGLCGLDKKHTEGDPAGGWMLIDYGSVIIHVFSREARKLYNIEKLYRGGSIELDSENNSDK